MTFRTSLLVAMLAVVAVMALATTLGVAVVAERAARRDVERASVRSHEIVRDLVAHRAEALKSQVRVVADEPRLKAVVATEDISRSTLLGVLEDMRRAASCDVLLLTDPGGKLVVDAAHPDEGEAELGGDALVARALEAGEASGVWADPRAVYQVHAQRLAFGRTTVGVLVLGYAWDAALTRSVERQTGALVVVGVDGAPMAESEQARGVALPRASDAASQDVSVAGARYIATSTSFAGYHGRRAVRVTLLHSLDDALATGRAVLHVVYVVLALASVLSLGAGLLLARRLAHPIGRLVDFTEVLGRGDLAARSEGRGPLEIRRLGEAMNRMATELAASRAKFAGNARIARELEIAAQIQTAILPVDLAVPGFRLAARMIPADEVGGDYYDVLPVSEGAFVGIGDVAGHGVTAGLVMLMVQSAVAAAVHADPTAGPAAVLRVVNAVVFDNVRRRMSADEHVTFTLLRLGRDGHVVFVGAHEDLIVLREGANACEFIRTRGVWMGVVEHLPEDALAESTLDLGAGDTLVLYTDGLTESRNAAGHAYELEPVERSILRTRDLSPDAMRDAILADLAGWAAKQDDDVTVVVVKYLGTG